MYFYEFKINGVYIYTYIYIYIYIYVYTCIYLYIYISTYAYMYICIYYLIKKCHPGHCHKSFMATGALGHTHVRLHGVGIQDTNNAQVDQQR